MIVRILHPASKSPQPLKLLRHALAILSQWIRNASDHMNDRLHIVIMACGFCWSHAWITKASIPHQGCVFANGTI